MRTVISMKKINSYNWTPRNQLNIPIPITDPPVDVEKLLGKLYFTLDYTLIISFTLSNPVLLVYYSK
jgi:hypothetical protein